ncbi:TlpA family protein disulfide reductase [Tamlana carrageenivorans]|uniref:TlpA family protein disulfide reductase n=2 Tax=Pseudotamlana carrageenivorans TaxID=2069432 RepID=A0A2I7SN18_9FLAO|nr:TlpA family protein disulfide reductase [Tamlana carrageenivorans]
MPVLMFGQHSIKGTFTPAQDYNVALLYKVTPTISEYITSTEVNSEGKFGFLLDSTATKGVYRVVYAIPQEDFNFDVIYNGKEDIELKFNSETGVKFTKSAENKMLTSYQNSMSAVVHSISNYYASEKKDTTALKGIFKAQGQAQLSYEKAASGTLALHFIKANKPYIPTKALSAQNYIAKLKTHYFDYVDFTNPILQSSSFLEEKMLNYVFGMTSKDLNEIDNYKANIDVVYKAMAKAPNEVKRMLLLDLWQEMVDLKQEKTANYISDKYLHDIGLALEDRELVNALNAYKRVSLGNMAPDFELSVTENGKKINKKLSQLNVAKQYILVFWNSSCSHCLDEIPQLKTFANTLEKGEVKVVAVGLEADEEIEAWKKEIKKYPEFIHVLGSGKWGSKIGKTYGIVETPTYFILNAQKVIVNKPEDIDEVVAFFELDDE